VLNAPPPRTISYEDSVKAMNGLLDGRSVRVPPGSERQRFVYPDDQGMMFVDLQDSTATYRDVRHLSHEVHIVHGACATMVEQHLAERAFSKKPLMGLNEIKAFAVDSANRILMQVMEQESPSWASSLRDTCTRENPGSIMLPVPIDGVHDIEQELDHYGRDKTYTLDMHKPSIPHFRYESAAYVSRISVKTSLSDFHTRSEFRIEVCEDTFEVLQRAGPQHFGLNIANIQTIPLSAVILNTEQEKVALEALREMVTERQYRNYLKRGFLIVKGSSGKEYQLFRTRWHAKVREKGKIVAEICSRILDNRVPLTDNVIAFKTMIEADETDFEKAGNVYRMTA